MAVNNWIFYGKTSAEIRRIMLFYQRLGVRAKKKVMFGVQSNFTEPYYYIVSFKMLVPVKRLFSFDFHIMVEVSQRTVIR